MSKTFKRQHIHNLINYKSFLSSQIHFSVLRQKSFIKNLPFQFKKTIMPTEKDQLKKSIASSGDLFHRKIWHSDKFFRELKAWSQKTQYIFVLFTGIHADFIYCNMNRKERRRLWAKDNMHWKNEWTQVLFQRKRDLKLMAQIIGPTVIVENTQHRQHGTLYYSQKKGGSVMTWDAFFFSGITDIAFLKGKQI